MLTIFGSLRGRSPAADPGFGSGVGWGPGRALFAGLRRAAGQGLFDLLMLWQKRASERHALFMLDDRALQDIGLSRTEAEREAGKPFWRA